MVEKNKDWTKHIGDKLRNGSEKAPDRVWDAIQRDMPKTCRSSNIIIRRWVACTSGIAALLAIVFTVTTFLNNKIDTIPDVTVAKHHIAAVTDSVPEQKTDVLIKAAVPAKATNITKDVFIADAHDLPSGNNKMIMTDTVTVLPDENIASDTIKAVEKTHDDEPLVNINDLNYAYDEIHQYKKHDNNRDQWSVGLSGTAVAMASNSNSSQKMFNVPSQTLEPDGDGMSMRPTDTYYKYEHFRPISIGVSASLNIGHGLQVGAGINYTRLHSRAIAAIDNSTKDQNLHMIGIPVSLTWSFINLNRFSSYVGVEAMGEKCVSANFGDEKVDEKELQFSVGGLVGVQYRILSNFAIYAEPKLNHYFTHTNLRTIRTDKNVIFNIQFGLRLTY